MYTAISGPTGTSASSRPVTSAPGAPESSSSRPIAAAQTSITTVTTIVNAVELRRPCMRVA